MLDHVSIRCGDATASATFHDAVLAPLGVTRVMDFGGIVGYGADDKPDFWIGPDATGAPNRENHLAYAAADRDAVRAFAAAVAHGAEVLHGPREWPEYHPGHFGSFVRDPDGNNVETVCHTPQ